MSFDWLLEWALPIIGGGGIGSVLTYIFTFKSQTKIANAEAQVCAVKAKHEELDLNQDTYDYIQEKCDKYIHDYHELEQTFREKVRGLVAEIDDLTRENSKNISEKCNEIASLKSQVTYLKGIRCYRFTCNDRIKTNPDKSE